MKDCQIFFRRNAVIIFETAVKGLPGTETAIEGSTDDVGVFVRLHSGNKAMDAKAGKVFVEAEFEKFIPGYFLSPIRQPG